MFATQTHILRSGRLTLQYAIIPWDSNYLHNTTIEINTISATSFTALQKLILQLQRKIKLKKGDLCLPLNTWLFKTGLLPGTKGRFAEGLIEDFT